MAASASIDELALTEGSADAEEPFAGYPTFAGAIGRRLGELHAVLSRPSDDPAFAPETATEADREGWAAGALAQLDPALDLLRQAQGLSEADKATAEQLLGRARGAARRHLAPRAGRGGRA